MSFNHAIAQREETITEYKRILKFETDVKRIADLEERIKYAQDEIKQLKTGKPLFGKPLPLTQTTTIIEPDPENKNQPKVTIINPQTEDQIDSASDQSTVKKEPTKLTKQLKKILNPRSQDLEDLPETPKSEAEIIAQIKAQKNTK